MATRKTITPDAKPAQPKPNRQCPFNLADAIDMLMAKATEPSQLTAHQLRYLIGAREEGRRLAGYAANVAEGIGCLVNTDESAGNFQATGDFLDLMCTFSGVFRQIEALNQLSEFAEYSLTQGEHHA